MTKHSKNNTASSIFSYAEYKKLDYGTKRQRLGNESMKAFNACCLCLERARNPLVCSKGHIFCTECVYTDLVTQSRDIKKQKQKLEALTVEAAEEKARAVEAARERVLRDFEKSQLGLSNKSSTETTSSSSASTSTEKPRNNKRKFEFDQSEMERLTREAEEDALRQLEREQADALRSKLPDFWLPSLTPTYTSKGAPRTPQDIKLQTTCRGGHPAHRLFKKDLVEVRFSFPSTVDIVSWGEKRPAAEEDVPFDLKKIEESEDAICPSCRKQFTNSHRMFLMKPCFHVTCKTCTDTLVKPGKQCVVCDAQLGEKDILELKREGTGFAAGGLAETSKTGISFQG